MTANIDMIKKVYGNFHNKIEVIRKIVGRPLTYAEKILYTHLWEQPTSTLTRGKDFADFAPDRVQ